MDGAVRQLAITARPTVCVRPMILTRQFLIVGKRLEKCLSEIGQLSHVEPAEIERFGRKENEIRLEETQWETRQLVGVVQGGRIRVILFIKRLQYLSNFEKFFK